MMRYRLQGVKLPVSEIVVNLKNCLLVKHTHLMSGFIEKNIRTTAG